MDPGCGPGAPAGSAGLGSAEDLVGATPPATVIVRVDLAAVRRGRTINRRLRTALAFRDRRCVVPGCGVAYGLEIDHVHPLESGGRTELDNLALLCGHHHRQKTYEGWVLERTGPTDEDPRWRFTPQPPFGQEPDLGLDLGLDRPPEGPGSG
jgi:hypothetical protein